MREQINNNPMYQMGLLGGLAALAAIYMLFLSGGGAPPAEPAPIAGAPGAPVAGALSTDPAAVPGASSAIVPDATGAGGTAPTVSAPAEIPIAALEPGKGLPLNLVKAYAEDQTVVILVATPKSAAGQELKESAEVLKGKKEVAVLNYTPTQIAKISRVTLAVRIDRSPAMIVIKPRSLTKSVPTATVSYGYRGPQSVLQQVEDATYKGPENLPSYP